MMNLINGSIAAIDEPALVDRLLSHPFWHGDIIKISGIPEEVVALTRLPLNGIDIEGEIDILLYSPTQPEVATAIEVKRIKVGATAFATGVPNKLQELRKAVTQANKLADAGFSQVYPYVFVVVDSRECNRVDDSGRVFTGATPELKSIIHQAISRCQCDLRSHIGLYQRNFVQWEDEDPISFGGRVGYLHRLAVKTAQRDQVTRWVMGQAPRP